MSENVTVFFYHCSCDWISKYCEDHHRVSVRLPESVLEPYMVQAKP